MEVDGQEEYVRGGHYTGPLANNKKEERSWDYTGPGYDDNFYYDDTMDVDLYPTFTEPQHRHGSQSASSDNPLAGLYPFGHPQSEPSQNISAWSSPYEKLEALVEYEVMPLFQYLSNPHLFKSLTSITIPLHYLSKEIRAARASDPLCVLPVKLYYWVYVVVEALRFLDMPDTPGVPRTLTEVRVKYMPQNTYAALEPSDDLVDMADKGVFFKDSAVDRARIERGDGEAFRAVWYEMDRWYDINDPSTRYEAEYRPFKLEGTMVGDGLEVVFTRKQAGTSGLQSQNQG